MPTFDDSIVSTAPIEEVWKLLYDPSRMAEWFAGVATVEPEGRDGRGDITVYPDAYPDFPMPQDLRTDRDGRRVTLSCLTNSLVFEWQLEPLDPGTRIAVHVEIPEEEAHRLEAQRGGMSASLRSLAVLAEATDAPRARG